MSAAEIPIGAAGYPLPFTPGLEFNPPAHGVWNIVHVGMLLPQAHQIYICALNCMRGVILTAAEMGASDRFSFVILKEEDLLEGTVEDVTIEGVTDVLHRLPKLPPAVEVFTVCLHRFLGSDLDLIFGELERRFPEVTFLRCAMEPITQKEGLTPDTRLRKAIFDPLEPRPVRERSAAVLGGDFPLDESADLMVCLRENGIAVRQLQECSTYAEYLTLSEAEVFLATFPRADYGVRETAARLGRRYFYLPASFSYGEIRREQETLLGLWGLTAPDTRAAENRCEEALARARQIIGDTPIAIDFTAHPRPLGLARLLLERGFRVETVYLDSVSGEEQEDFLYLKRAFPGLLLSATNQPECRVRPRTGREGTLAVGQIAAWFCATPHFVNIVEGGGLWGFDGIVRMAELMTVAFLEEKDTGDLVPRKGLGCESCI